MRRSSDLDEVDDHDIAFGGATRLLDRFAVLLLRRHALERLVDGRVVYGGDGALDLEGPEVHRADLRHQLDRHPVLEILRSEEHTSELQSLMRISYAFFCLTKKTST